MDIRYAVRVFAFKDNKAVNGEYWLVSGKIIRAVTILAVFLPCALVLATPTAIMAAIENAAKHGFLVREGDQL